MVTILFADNDPSFLITRAEFLENEGYRVLKASSLGEARHLLSETYIHLAVLDIRMVDDDDEKDVSGLTLAQDPAYRLIPKIILTGFPTYRAVREALGPAVDGLPPAVGFLDKNEGPHALIQAVEQACAQHVRINRKLRIRWGRKNDLSPLCLVHLVTDDLARERLVDRTGELEDLFRKLFYEYSQIILGRILVRRDGWILLTGFAYREHGPHEQFAVACGCRESIQVEIENVESCIPNKTGRRAVSLVKSAETVHFGAAAYRLGGSQVEQVTTFNEFYDRKPTNVILASVDELFQLTLRPLYRERQKINEPVEILCTEWLNHDGGVLYPAEIQDCVTGVCRDALAVGITSLDCSPYKLAFRSPEGTEFFYPNPAPYLCEGRVTTSPPTLCGTTHGRLDGASVLVDNSGQTWVMDFGKAGLGPLVRDFVSLEAAIKFDILTGTGIVARHELESRLLAMSSLGSEIDTHRVGSEVGKALQVIGQLRSNAADVVGPQIEPYLMGLLLCAVERLLGYRSEFKYTRSETETFVHALLSIGMICQRLIGWENRLRDLPSQAAESLWLDEESREVWVEGRQVTMSPQVFDLFKYLYDHANHTCRRVDIAEHAFGVERTDYRAAEARLMDKDLINTNIRRLRKAIEPNPSHPKYVLTVHGVGYKLALGDIPSRDDV